MFARLAPLALSPILLLASVGLAQPVQSAGTIDAVTVYRGQALVSRLIDVPGAAGLREVVVTGLPEFIVPASLYAESADGVEVRSVSYRVRPVPEDTRESVRGSRSDSAVRDNADQLKRKLALLEHNAKYLDKIEQFLGVTGSVEMGKGVLNADTISKMTEFLFTTRKAQLAEGDKLRLDIRTAEEQAQLLERNLANQSAKSSRTAREAVVFINMTNAGGKVRLNYLVDRATWMPSYNLRALSANATLEAVAESPTVIVEYQASIQQMSGEDWPNIQMTLSTATPALVAMGPTLSPLTVALSAPHPVSQALASGKSVGADKAYEEAKKEIAFKQRELEQSRNSAVNAMVTGGFQAQIAGNTVLRAESGAPDAKAGSPAPALPPVADLYFNYSLNDLAGQSQLLDFATNERFDRKSKDAGRNQPGAEARDEGVSVTYRIASRTTLPSRADQQLIQIARTTFPATFAKVATPVLTGYVYNEAVITNAGELVLLAGPASAYVAGEFVGRGIVPTVAAGETFTAGFGIDSLRTGRELVERTETIQGGNRVVEFTYRLSVENFGRAPTNIRLIDRMPNPKGADIKLTLLSPGKDLSKDPAYEAADKKNGILRWDLAVPPQKAGADAFSLDYKFRLEFDKQMGIGEAGK